MYASKVLIIFKSNIANALKFPEQNKTYAYRNHIRFDIFKNKF